MTKHAAYTTVPSGRKPPRAGWLLAGLLAFAPAGCYQPISGAGAKSPATARRPSRAGITQRKAPTSAHLKVGSETIEPGDVWNPIRSETLQRFRGASVDECRRFVESESVKWVTNKVAESLLYQRAVLRVGSELDESLDKLIDAQVRKTITTDFGGVQWRFEQHLAADGRTLDDVRRNLRRELIIARFLETEIRPKAVEPTRAELLALYHEVARNQQRAEQRQMSLIDVRTLSQLPRETTEPSRAEMEKAREAARRKIEAARQEIVSGTDFADVARRYSEGLHASDGGSWGWIKRGSVRERFEPAVDALFFLEPGQVSEILETPDGFFLVRCDAVDANASSDFASMQPELKERWFRQAYNRLVAELLTKLQARAHLKMAEVDAFQQQVTALAAEDCRNIDALPESPLQREP